MNCEQAQLELGAAPDERTDELTAHLAQCGSCQAYLQRSLRLDGRIRRAMQLPPPGLESTQRPEVGLGAARDAPPSLPSRAPAAASRRRPLWALAASVVAAAFAVLLLWPAQPSQALADELVEHVSGADEVASWNNTAVVAQSEIDQVLRAAGVHIDTRGLSPVVYAHTCWFRDRYVPHLVLRTSQGPLTVIALPGERLEREEQFIESDYSGVLLPQRGGAIAVLAQGRKDVSFAARELGSSIRLQP